MSSNVLLITTPVLMTLIVALQLDHDPKIFLTFIVYVVVVVGCTWILFLLRVGYKKLSPAIYGVIVASAALVYDALSRAVAPGAIRGVEVVKVHAAGILLST